MLARRPARPSAVKAPPWRRRLLRAAVILLLGPLALIAVYRVVPPPATLLMLVRAVQGHGLEKDWVPLAEMSPWLARAVVAHEDNQFCRHRGFDWRELRGQLDRLAAGDGMRGASTITQQAAKNVLLWPGRDWIRKGLEAWFAPQLELLWGKRRIIEIYLNVAELGPGIYGAEAAARHWFGKPAADLTRRESALLAAILPSPLRWSAAEPTRYITGRARTAETRITQLGPLLDCLPPAG